MQLLNAFVLLISMVAAVASGAPLVVMGPSVSSAAPVRMEEHATTSLESAPVLRDGR